jgi:hypothetical protein
MRGATGVKACMQEILKLKDILEDLDIDRSLKE